MHAQMSRPPGPPRSLMISVRPTPRKGAVSRPAFGAGLDAAGYWSLLAFERVSQPISASGITGAICIYCGRGAVLPLRLQSIHILVHSRLKLELHWRSSVCAPKLGLPDLTSSTRNPQVSSRIAIGNRSGCRKHALHARRAGLGPCRRPAAIVLPSRMPSYTRDMLFAGLF